MIAFAAAVHFQEYSSLLCTCLPPPCPLAKVKIPVRIHAAHAQSAWAPFLNHVKHELELEDIEGIYDDVDGAPVIRTASLVDGGLYFARPTEVWPHVVGYTFIRTVRESTGIVERVKNRRLIWVEHTTTLPLGLERSTTSIVGVAKGPLAPEF